MGRGRTRTDLEVNKERCLKAMAKSGESEKSYYGNNDFRNYFGCLGDSGREEFIEWLNSLSNHTECRNDSVDYEFSVPYENNLYMCGRTLVYLYTSVKGIPFYVGKGNNDRATNIYNRPEAFMDKLKEYGDCRVFAIAHNVRDDYALTIETMVINELLDRGWRLTNSQKVAIGNEEKARLRNQYPEILESITKITGKAISYLLDEHESFGDRGIVRMVNKTAVRSVKEPSLAEVG